MDISVLLCVYAKDNAAYYDMALESVADKQTVRPKQIVVVFDGPVPGEIEKITEKREKANADIEFTVVRLQKNSGLAAALNEGIKHCKYEYIARMDADDIAVNDRFQKQISYLLEHPEIDILGGLIAEFADDPQKTGAVRKVGITHEQIVEMAKKRTPFNHMTVVYKKSKVCKAGGYNVDFGKLEDYKLWVDMIAGGCKTANLDEVLILMRVGNGLISRRSNRREIKDWDNLQKDLISAGLINKRQALQNKIYIRVFTYMPSGLKKLAYNTFLRKKQ